MVRHQNVLLHKFRVGDEQRWAGNAIVVIVLAVDLLVIVSAAQSVGRKSLPAVEVGEIIVAGGNHAGNEQSEIVQTLVFLDAGESVQLRAGEGIGNLRLRRFNQRRLRSDLHGGGGLTDSQLNRAQPGIATRGNQNAILDGRIKLWRRDVDFVLSRRYQAEAEQP